MSIYRYPIMLRVTKEIRDWLKGKQVNEYIRELIRKDMERER